MPGTLLDVNVLLALAWPNSIYHEAAHAWFAQSRALGWATCPLTQLGFVRLSLQPAVTKVPLGLTDAWEALAQFTADRDHRFWPLEAGVLGIREEIRKRITGPRQLTDAMLLELAIRHKGRLATFDGKLQALLPPDSVMREALAIIPA